MQGAKSHRRVAGRAAALVALAGTLTACFDDGPVTAPSGIRPTPTTSATTPVTTTASTPAASAPSSPSSRAPSSSPSLRGSAVPVGSTMLADVRTAAREGSDRLVLEFTGQAPPYAVTRQSGPIRDCGSGNQVAGAGEYLVVRAEPVGIFDHDGQTPYTGPRTVAGPGGAITRAVISCSFEGQLQVAVRVAGDGLSYKDFTLGAPGRIVLDVRR